MTDTPDAAWWRAAPPAEAEIRCGDGGHVVRWADGALRLPAHPDPEAERILGALGGEKAACVRLAEAWDRHRDDLAVLALGPRSAADPTDVTWDDAENWPRFVFRGGFVARAGPVAIRVRPGRGRALSVRSQRVFASRGIEIEQAESGLTDLMSLLALGTAFQLRLAGTVTGAWSAADRAADRAARRPALVAALAGLAPAAESWLGVDPGLVTVSLHEGPGWGRLEPADSGAGGGLRASLPLDWLARVWACGLAVVDGHLVVAVRDAQWPDARVLALAGPGAEPVLLSVRASGAERAGDDAHWAITDTGEEAGGT